MTKNRILVRIFDGDDYIIRIVPSDYVKTHNGIDAEEIISEPYDVRHPEMIKFTENGLGGLYWYTEEELKKKLEELRQYVLNKIIFRKNGTAQYKIIKKNLDGDYLEVIYKDFENNLEANKYVASLPEGRETYWGYEINERTK